MSDIIDMTVPAQPSPTYAGIIKGAGCLREEAGSCDRCGTVLLTAGGIVAIACWSWAGWSLVHLQQGVRSDVPPFGVAAATVFGLATFMFAWALCGNYRRRAIALRLSADLAMAQRDVAINSHARPTAAVIATPSVTATSSALYPPMPSMRPLTPAHLPQRKLRVA